MPTFLFLLIFFMGLNDMLAKVDGDTRIFELTVDRLPLPVGGFRSCDDCSFYGEFLSVVCPKNEDKELLCLTLACPPKKYINFRVEGIYKKGVYKKNKTPKV